MLKGHTFINIPVSYKDVCSDRYFSVALKTDGSAWCWGGDSSSGFGECGDNTITFRSSPVSVVGNHSFTSIFCGGSVGYGLKSDGTAWCWGYNAAGGLGQNNTTYRSSPVSVVGNHSFIQISAGQGEGGGPNNGLGLPEV